MRLKEEIAREGEFCLPGDKKSVTGNVFIIENQKIILEVNGSISDKFFMATVEVVV